MAAFSFELGCYAPEVHLGYNSKGPSMEGSSSLRREKRWKGTNESRIAWLLAHIKSLFTILSINCSNPFMMSTHLSSNSAPSLTMSKILLHISSNYSMCLWCQTKVITVAQQIRVPTSYIFPQPRECALYSFTSVSHDSPRRNFLHKRKPRFK